MESGHRFAAIDVGSNAIRMLFARVLPNGDVPYVVKESMFRMPLRLGADTFVRERIGEATAEKLLHTLHAFRHLVSAYEPVDLRACATSAMRRAQNGPELVERIRRETSFEIEIIEGSDEARIILANHVESRLDPKRNYVYVDVGGGSTEVTVLAKRKPVSSCSFPVGSVRLLTGNFEESVWDGMRDWLKTNVKGIRRPRAIGSGGNINKIFTLVGAKRGRAIRLAQIEAAIARVREYDVEDRVRLLGLRPDRADVIDHAARIYLSVMEWSGARKMYVPQVGLADGLVQEMYRDFTKARAG